MKLLKIINKKYTLFSVIMLITGTVLIYFFLRYFITRETIEKLENTKEDVIKSLDRGNKVEFYPVIEIKSLDENNSKEPGTIKDTTIYNPDEQEQDSYKQISFIYNGKNGKYIVYVRTDNIDASDLFFPLGAPIFLLVLSLLFIYNVIVNRINIRIWKPFYKNIKQLRKFSAADKNELQLLNSGIDEFKDLNESLKDLTNRIRNDYGQLKEFSENVSHELQTPLSIIRVKIETMLQNENLDGGTLDKLQSIYKMINRLSRLNRSLVLLLRLESADYEKKEEICLIEFISKKLNDFSEIAGAKQVGIKTKFISDKRLLINPDLLEILFYNLFSNSIKYNIEGGDLIIELSGNELIIKNTGLPPSKDPGKMFDRFEKGNHSDESSGLGLTIVKQICTIYRFNIRYYFEDPYHIIQITLPA